MRRSTTTRFAAITIWTTALLVAAGGPSAAQRFQATAVRVPGELVRPTAAGPAEPSAPVRPVARPSRELLLGAPRTGDRAALGGLQIGFRTEPIGSDRLVRLERLDWQPAGDGRAAAVSLRSSGARAIRLGLDPRELPPSTRLRFFGDASAGQASDEVSAAAAVTRLELSVAQDRAMGRVGAVTGVDEADSLYWSPIVKGDLVGVELWLPGGVEPAGRLVGLTVSHLVEVPWERPSDRDPGRPGARMCMVDIACDPQWREVAKSVAKVTYTRNGGTFTCTGQLMADTDGSTAVDYFATANHCLDRQSFVDTSEFYWFFQSDTCDGVAPADTPVTRGAALLQTLSQNTSTDFSLLLLDEPPPVGTTRTGWSTVEPDKEKPATGIHHPLGDVKKVSDGLTKLLGPNGAQDFDSHIWVRWDSGVTDQGSSGSGLWLDGEWPDQDLIGLLSSGQSACTAQDGLDFYGRFDLSYPELEPWLDPASVPEVASGADTRGAVEPGEWQLYRVAPLVTRGVAGAATALLRDVVGDPDLYLLGGLAPTAAVFDCRSQTASGQQEECEAAGVTGTVFVGVHGNGETRAEYTLVASVDPGPSKPPKKPKKLKVKRTAPGRLEITWKDRARDETGFSLERRIGSGTWEVLATLPADTTSAVDQGLEPKLKTCYRLRAFNEAGSSAATGKRCARP